MLDYLYYILLQHGSLYTLITAKALLFNVFYLVRFKLINALPLLYIDIKIFKIATSRLVPYV
jgi:hypothetical protein